MPIRTWRRSLRRWRRSGRRDADRPREGLDDVLGWQRRHFLGARIVQGYGRLPVIVARQLEIALIELANPPVLRILRAVLGELEPHQPPRALTRRPVADEQHMSEQGFRRRMALFGRH